MTPENPYAPPQSSPPEAAMDQKKKPSFFQRILNYQAKAIYLGLGLLILCLILGSAIGKHSQLTGSLLIVVAQFGGFLFVVSILLTLPFSIWGIIDGYLTGRKNRLAAQKNSPPPSLK